MPNITLVRSHLFEAIGREYSDREFDELCFEFGVEVDDVSTEVRLSKSPTTLTPCRSWSSLPMEASRSMWSM